MTSNSRSKQSLFKVMVPRNTFMNYLYNVATITDDGYKYNHDSYKRGNIMTDDLTDEVFNNLFCESLLDNYYKHKQFYVLRKNTYNKYTTLIRQLCNLHGIHYTIESGSSKSQMFSTYDIKI